MPTYNYKCKKCGKDTEEFHSITADPIVDCSEVGCDGEVIKVISNNKSGFVLKGQGYYKGGHNV